MPPTMAITNTEARANSRIAVVFVPNTELMKPDSAAGAFFPPRTLSTTIVTGHGSRRSAAVSPSTARNAKTSGFQ